MKAISFLTTLVLLVSASSLPAQVNIDWQRYYGSDSTETCSSILPTSDGGYAMLGWMNSYEGTVGNILFMKVDANGDSLWSHIYAISVYSGMIIRQTADGGFVLAFGMKGLQSNLILRLDANGASLWAVQPEYQYWSPLTDLIVTSDGGLAVIGETYNRENRAWEPWLWLLNSEGNQIGKINYTAGSFNKIVQTADGGFTIAGEIQTEAEGNRDFGLIHTNEVGDTLWTRNYGVSYLEDMVATSDGGYALMGRVELIEGAPSLPSIFRTNEVGDTLWTRSFEWIGEYPEIKSVVATPDGGLTLLGQFDIAEEFLDRFVLMRLNSLGDTLWTTTYFDEHEPYLLDLACTLDGGYVMAGGVNMREPRWGDIWLLKTTPDPVAVKNEPVALWPSSLLLEPAYPNPFNSTVTISYSVASRFIGPIQLAVYDMSGRLVTTLASGVQTAGAHKVVWDGGSAPAGIYIARLEAGGKVASIKLAMVK